jgi:hypothetical protein
MAVASCLTEYKSQSDFGRWLSGSYQGSTERPIGFASVPTHGACQRWGCDWLAG